MKFANPNFLYAFFLLIIPIIIHLFNFRKHKTIYFSNTKFLKQVEEQTKSVSTIKHWILLFTRLLLFTSLILAFAGPFIPQDGNEQKTDDVVAIYIDNSNSMQMMSTEGILLSNALKTAKSIVERSDNRTKFLVTSNDFVGSRQRLVNKSEALDFIDDIQFSNQTKSLNDVYEYQSSYLKEKEQYSNTRFVAISDFQKSTIGLPFKMNDSVSNIYTPVYLKSINTGNLYIDSVWYETPLRTTNLPNKLFFRVQNTSNEDANSVGIEFTNGDLSRRQSIDIQANSSKTGSLSYIDKNAGLHSCKLVVKDKHVTFDDQFFFSYSIKNDLSITIIDDNESNKNVEDLYKLDSNFSVKSFSYNSLPSDAIAASNLVVINEVNNLSGGMIDQLVKFTNNGGSLIIFPSENANVSQYNTLLGKLKMPQIDQLKQSQKISSINYKEPFFKNVFEKEEKNVAFPNVNKHYPILGNVNLGYQSLMEYQNGTPFMLKSAQLNKQIYLSSVGLNEAFGSFGKHALFSTILLRISELSSSKNPIYCNLTSPSVYRFTLSSENEDASIKLLLEPDQNTFIPAQKRNGKLIEAFINSQNGGSALSSGNHKVIEGENEIGLISINQDFKESNLETIEFQNLESLFRQSGFKNVSSVEILESETDFSLKLENRKEYWRILLILALVFLVIEILVIKLMKG